MRYKEPQARHARIGHPLSSQGLGPTPLTVHVYSCSPKLAKMAEGKPRQSSSCSFSSRARAGLLLPRAISCLEEAEHCYYHY